MNIIGKRISEVRKAKGLSQERLADLSRINLRTIQRIENNKSEPHGKTLNLICEVLDINLEELLKEKDQTKNNSLETKIVNVFFLIVLNLTLMAVVGYLTLDSEANINSRLGAVLLSFFIPLFIVQKTEKLNGIKRLLKFGSGYLIYLILVIISPGIPKAFVCGLIPCLIVSMAVLYFGKALIRH